MAQRTTRRKIATVNYSANQTVTEDLKVSGKIRRLWLELSGVNTVTTVGSPTVVARNPGSLISNLSLTLDRDITLKSGRWNDWRDRQYMFSKLPAETAEASATGATTIASRIQLPFLTPNSIRPVDTVLDMDAHQSLEIAITWGDEDSLLNGATTQAFTTNPTVDVIAEISRFDPAPVARYIERAFDSNSLGTSANTDLQLELNTGPRVNYHHLLLVAEDNPGAAGRSLVSTALNSVLIEQQGAGEVSNPFGKISGDELQHMYDVDFSREGVQTGLYPIEFQGQFDGRATFNMSTAGLNDLRIRIDHAAFTTDGYIRTVYGTYEPFNA